MFCFQLCGCALLAAGLISVLFSVVKTRTSSGRPYVLFSVVWIGPASGWSYVLFSVV